MKKNLLISLALGGLISLPVGAENLLSFPGAEGYGRFATGGRGGEIYHVTNLNDSGTGSFRDAISKPNRIIVFDVSGIINIKSGLVFSKNLTVLGQTAPGEGVQIYGNRVSFSGANNIIVRHMRFRMGVNGENGKDAAGVAYGANMMFDHLSVLWGRDENFSINWDSKKTDQEPTDITIQNSIMGQGLQPHSCGGLIQTNGGVTLFRNLYIENSTRNPKVKGLNQFVNNVVCNWGNGAAYNMGGDSAGDSWAEITGNYFVKGPWKSATLPLIGGNTNFKFYGDDNFYDSNLNGLLDGIALTDEDYKESGGNRMSTLAQLATVAGREYPEITQRMTANEAIAWVAEKCGASLPVRDEVDQYLIDELLSYGTSGSDWGISSEKELPHQGTGRLFGGFKPLDTDGDGIPDEWEMANGLDPNDASDAAKIAANGYANIENYVFTIDAAYPYLKNPTELHATSNEKNAITIAWTDNSETEKEFVIEMSLDGKDFAEKARVGANTTSYRVDGLETNTVHYFRIMAVGEDGLVSVYSPVLKTLTIENPTTPEVSTNPVPADGGSVKQLNLKLGWKNSTEEYFGQTKYDVYLGETENSLEKIASNLTETQLNPGILEADKTYYWRVDATNDVGTTEGTVWNFKVEQGGTLFYTDFHSTPASFADSKWGTIIKGSQADMITAGTPESFEFDNMTIASDGGRVVAFGNLSVSSSSYAPYTSADAGASNNAVGFIGKNGNVAKSYILLSEMEGPWKITLFTGNSDAADVSFKVKAGEEEKSFSMAAKKSSFKFSYVYDKEDVTDIRIGDATSSTDKKGINFFDILVEKYVKEESGVKLLESGNVIPEVDVYGETLSVNNLGKGDEVILYDLSGRIAGRETSIDGGSVSFVPGKGVYIVSVRGMNPVKVIL